MSLGQVAQHRRVVGAWSIVLGTGQHVRGSLMITVPLSSFSKLSRDCPALSRSWMTASAVVITRGGSESLAYTTFIGRPSTNAMTIGLPTRSV